MPNEVKLLPCNSAEFCCVRKMGDYVLMAVTPKGEETLRYWLSLGGAEVLAAEISGAMSRPTTVVTDEVVERVAHIAEWIEKRRGLNKSDRREAVTDDDNYSQAFATGALLELIELESFLFGRVTDKSLASMPTVVTGEQPLQSVGDYALPPSGLSPCGSQAKPAAAIARGEKA